MNGFLRIDHAVRAFAARLPGSAGWALLEVLSRSTMRDARVSVPAIMEALGIGERTARRALQDLHNVGVIVFASNAAVLAQDWRQVCNSDCTSLVTKLSKSESNEPVPDAQLESTKEGKKERSKEVSSSSLRSELPPEIPKKFDATKLELSSRLKSLPNFAAAWLEWVNHRREIRKPLTPTSVKQQLEMLETHPDPVGCIRASLQSGWAGLFAERGLPAKPAMQSSTSPPRRNGINDPEYWARAQADADAKIEAILAGGANG